MYDILFITSKAYPVHKKKQKQHTCYYSHKFEVKIKKGKRKKIAVRFYPFISSHTYNRKGVIRCGKHCDASSNWEKDLLLRFWCTYLTTNCIDGKKKLFYSIIYELWKLVTSFLINLERSKTCRYTLRFNSIYFEVFLKGDVFFQIG